MAEQVKIGVIGTSDYADWMHLEPLATYERAALLAVCGRNQARADEMAAKHRIPHVHNDFRDMIENGGLDAVVIVSPDDLHYDMALAALDAGVHVICEKPLALNVEEARTMADRAAAAGVRHMVYHTFRWVPNFYYLKQLVDQGYIGAAHHGMLRYIAGYARSSKYSWRFDGDRANGILGDLGSHMIDLARWYMGEITSVSASIANHYDRQHPDGRPVTPANDVAALHLMFDNGAQASIEVSAAAFMAEREMHQETALYGADGTLETTFLISGPDYHVRAARSTDQHFSRLDIPADLLSGITADKPFGNFLQQPIGSRYFVDCILDDKIPSPSFADGYQIQRILDAALESQRTGQRVQID